MHMHVKWCGMGQKIAGLDLTETGTCGAFNLKRAARAVARLYDAELAAAGVRSTQFAILVAAAKSGPAPVGHLAELTGTDQTTMTRALQLMADEGLVAIGKRGKGRTKIVSLTPAGTRKLKRAVPVWRAAHARFTKTFGIGRWRSMQRELERAAKLDNN
jgi:DNA-binding MarR family transcriptional regulator